MNFLPYASTGIPFIVKTGHAPSLQDAVSTYIPFWVIVVETWHAASLHDVYTGIRFIGFVFVVVVVVVAETQLIASLQDASLHAPSLHDVYTGIRFVVEVKAIFKKNNFFFLKNFWKIVIFGIIFVVKIFN